MSNFLNKIPVSPISTFGSPSVTSGAIYGTNFSVLQVGGYMEVFSLSALTYTIPPTTGLIEFAGNSIPIHFTKGSGTIFSPDVLTLNSDNISSGRRKLGMLVYVYETDKIYQYTIDNYQTLWNNATGATGPGGSTVVISDFGTTIKNNSAAGIAFINAWTASTISGVGGYDDTNASWRILPIGGLTDVYVTGGTYSLGTSIFTNNSGGTFSVTGFSKYFVTGSTPSGYTINNGDRWYNTTSGIELVYFDDGSSSQWVQPPNTPGPPGYSNLLTTTGITVSSTTLDINYNYYGVNYNGIVNITLPNPSGYDGRNINIKDEGGYAGTYRIRLIPSVGLIDGNSYVDMNINYISLHIVARNNNWWII